MTTCVASDLHLFSRRSNFADSADAFYANAAQSDLLVLNGDVFDFKWSDLGPLDATIDAAVHWLETLLVRTPDCQLHYVLGNHDALAPLAARLTRLADHNPRFHWHPTHFQIGTNLFHHGDLLLNADPATHWHRQLAADVAVKGRFRNIVYDATVEARLHRAPEILNQPARVARRVVRALHASPDPEHATVTDLYVGHTHLAFDAIECNGVRVHNTGCAIRHLHFRPQSFAITSQPALV